MSILFMYTPGQLLPAITCLFYKNIFLLYDQKSIFYIRFKKTIEP